MQFIGRDSHDVTVFGMHVADAEEVLTAAKVVMIEFKEKRHCCETRAGESSKWVQSEAIGAEKDDIEDEGDSNCGYWPFED